jgi:hypothetical protein
MSLLPTAIPPSGNREGSDGGRTGGRRSADQRQGAVIPTESKGGGQAAASLVVEKR